jgi:NAD(P)-dependent dehydrogenase (short-subunit alcohol dehydrogenase family)
LGFFSLLYLAQALGEQRRPVPVELSVVTDGIQNVSGDERVAFPEKATVLGPCKVIPYEYPDISCRVIDVSIPVETPQLGKLVERLITELTGPVADSIIAYRGGHRWVQIFEPLRLEQQKTFPTRLRHGGVYLITGGLGGLGLEFAEYLARTAQAKLVLTGRSALPPRHEWDDQLTHSDLKPEERGKIERLIELEKLGAEVLVIAADVADAMQMKNVIEQTRHRFGEIQGIIHSAGVPGEGIVQLKTHEMVEEVFAAKIKGTRTVQNLFSQVKLDFLVLCSSLTAILGGPGRVDYSAANAFLDAFANHCSCEGNDRLTISINWAAWQSVGMAAHATTHVTPADREARLEKGISPSEGVDAFSRILGLSLPQVLISTRELGQRLRQQISDPHPIEAAISTQPHPRPELSNQYVAPRTEVERKLTHIWQTVLGIEDIGVHDNFFELGGHSLAATRVVMRMIETFQVNLPIKVLFDSPTVIEMAAIIAQNQATLTSETRL